ncbi:MAG: enoyl-CoA hydratase/isomerase family protein [Cytophagales bacterium]|nr:enoyl-CoA hydratase/isomerase family protein [Cytophaga sp.]
MANVLLTVIDKVATVSINRPQVYNALNIELIEELTKAFEEADNNPGIECVFFTGEGKGFCSGLDLQWALQIEAQHVKALVTNHFNRLSKAIHHCRKPVICILHGPASGAGASLVLACDVIYATEQGSLSFPFLSLGLQPDTGMSYYLKKRVGYYKAFEWLLECKTLSATEALEHNIVQKVFPDETSLKIHTERFVKQLQSLQAGAVTSLKLLLSAREHNLEFVLNEEAEQQSLAIKGGMLKVKIAEFLNRKS